MLSAKDVAKYFLSLSDPEIGDYISNLKLQKLLYYAQGFCLALHDRPLFSEKILAWEHGPVVEEVYRQYKANGSAGIEPEGLDLDFSIFTEQDVELLKDVYNVFGQYSAWKLRNMTHEEFPWQSAARNEEIKHSVLKTYFKNYI